MPDKYEQHFYRAELILAYMAGQPQDRIDTELATLADHIELREAHPILREHYLTEQSQ